MISQSPKSQIYFLGFFLVPASMHEVFFPVSLFISLSSVQFICVQCFYLFPCFTLFPMHCFWFYFLPVIYLNCVLLCLVSLPFPLSSLPRVYL